MGTHGHPLPSPRSGGPVDLSSRSTEVLTTGELASLLRIDRKTLYALIARGEIPGVLRFGRAIRISARAVDTWLREQR